MTAAASYRIYSKHQGDKSYLRVDPETGTHQWVRYWRDATGFVSRKNADDALDEAQRRAPERAMCVVIWGTRQASLPGGGS